MIATLLSVALAAPLHADRPQPHLRWSTIETERFRIHFPRSRRDEPTYPIDAEGTARRLAAVADTLWLRIADHTGWFPTSTMHVVVVDDADQLTAFSLPHWEWIVISAHPGVEVHRLRGRTSWESDALAHELSHVFAHELSGALAQVASGGLEATTVVETGPVALSARGVVAPNEPYWWSEGTAELWSEHAGVNHWSTGRDAELRLSALEGRLLTWEEWGVSADKGDHGDAERAYVQGYAFARWLQAEHGEDVLLDLGRAASEGWRPAWSHTIEAELGEPARQVYARWRAHITAHYAGQGARLRARGIVEGAELERWTGSWVADDLAARDRWESRGERDREETRESTGTWELHPQLSGDGRWLAEGRVGWVRIQRTSEALLVPLVGRSSATSQLAARVREARDTTAWLPAALGSSVAFVPGHDAVIVAAEVGTEHPSPLAPHLRPVSHNQLYRVDLTPATRRERPVLPDGPRSIRQRYDPIAGTLRAHDPAVSPDGEHLAFIQVHDGTANLVVSRLDGSQRRVLSDFDDGTWLRSPSWSPDGRRLVVSALRTDRPDLWTVDVETGAWSQLTADAHDQRDPVWTEAGIWFASDPPRGPAGDRVFDIYRLEPEQGRVVQATAVLGGAHTPSVTPEGHLLYSGRTAFGFKSFGLRADEHLDRDVTQRFGLSVSAEEAARDLAFRPDLPQQPVRPYRPAQNLLAPVVAPLVRVDATQQRVVPLGGAWIRLRDALELHELTLEGLGGEDWIGQARWTWRRWLPELSLWGSGARDRRTVDVGDTVDLFWRQLGAVGATATLPWRDEVRLRGDVLALQLGIADATGGEPRLQSVRTAATLELGEARRRADDHRRDATLSYTHAWSEAAPGQGGAVDDGALLERYRWHRLRTSGGVSVPLALSTGPLRAHRHRLELGWTAGWTSRNVLSDEELRAGGTVPAALRPAVVEGTAYLPGYAPFALSGETLAVGSIGWWVPVAPRLRAGGSALYLESVSAVIGADAGNAWSYAGGRLERPFLDRPSDHGHPVVADVRAELRLSTVLADVPWDSVVRAAWGLQDVGPLPPAGPVADAAGRPASGPRLTVGLGTGW